MTSDPAARLRRQGYRLTPQRLMVLEALAQTGEHMSAEAIHERVAERYPYINLSTVYRTLDMLVSEHIVRQAEGGDERRLYELASSSEPHHHLVCRRCGRIEHVRTPHLLPVESSLLEEHGFEVDESVVTSFGTCLDCRRDAGG